MPRYFVYLEVTQSLKKERPYDRILVHRINSGMPEKIQYPQNLKEAIEFVYHPAIKDAPWSDIVSISFEPPWGKVTINQTGEMEFFSALPESMQTEFCLELQKLHATDLDNSESDDIE